jgi:hypothetical protein
MKAWQIVAVTLSLLVLGGSAHAQGKRPEAKKFGWYSDLETARTAARQSGKPLFVVFRCEA